MIRHYYHVYADGAWERPVAEHLDALTRITFPIKLTVGLVGAPANRARARAAFSGVEVWCWTSAEDGWEQVTLDALRRDLVDHNDPVLYAHTKGASDPSPLNHAWRRSMTRHVVGGWRDCLGHLSGVDAVGCHWLTPRDWPGTCVESPFFGGNYWWATAAYLRRLPRAPRRSRFDAERWIGSRDPRVHDLMPGWPSTRLFAAA